MFQRPGELRAAIEAAAPALLKDPRQDHLFHRLVEALTQDGRLTPAVLRRLSREEKVNLKERRHLARMLALTNAAGLTDAVLPVTEVPATRPSSLVADAKAFREQATVLAMLEFLPNWEPNQKGKPGADGRGIQALLAAAIMLVCRAGMSDLVLVGSLSRLSVADITPEGDLRLAVDPRNFMRQRYRFRPPTACREHLLRLRNMTRRLMRSCGATLLQSQRDAEVLLISAALSSRPLPCPKDEKGVEDQIKDVQQFLRKEFRRFASAWTHSGEAACRPLRHWRRFAAIGRLLPVYHDVPPVFVELFRRYGLPTSPDGVPPILETEAEGHPATRHQRPGRATSAPLPPLQAGLTRPAGLRKVMGDTVPHDWPALARNHLRAFLASCSALCKDGEQALRSGKQDDLILIRHEALRRLSEVSPSWTIAHAGIVWGADKLLRGGVKLTTLRTYFSRLFPPEMLSCEETYDIRVWDDDTVGDLTWEVLSRPSWSRQSEQLFYDTWLEFLRYCCAQGFVEDVIELPKRGAMIHAAARTELLTPHEVELLWWHLVEDEGGRDAEALAVALTLGYYGGLRAAEVTDLTLRTVCTEGGECLIYVAAGKTKAARRQIPLHRVAPPEMVEQVQGWVARRRAEFRRPVLDRIALLGPEGQEDAYAREGIITPLIAVMRQFFGTGVDYHLLRHCAVSWMILRLQAARDPEFRSRLHHRDAWMFGTYALAEANALFSGPGAETAPAGDQWLRLAKFIGHRHVGTLLLHYSHTIGAVHSRHLELAWQGRPRHS